jgi:hypothetical protein
MFSGKKIFEIENIIGFKIGGKPLMSPGRI